MKKLQDGLEGMALGKSATLLRDAEAGTECVIPVKMESTPKAKGRSFSLNLLDWKEVEEGVFAAQIPNKGAIIRTAKSLNFVEGLSVRNI